MEYGTSTPQQVKTIQSHYDYTDVLQWIEKKGLELYGTGFGIVETDHPVIYRLIAYFLKDEQTALQFGIDLTKGILLTGPVGCGKTSLMTIMKYLSRAEHKFIVKPCRDVSFEFINDGYGIIHKYGKDLRLRGGQPVAARYCFDDLGVEQNLKYYGNDCNVMAEILLSSYDVYVSKKVITHITTNLSASEIENHYGIRVRSRLRQMVNLIAFDKNTKDKR
jgi:energy-coupling factor transporter ATP-binding protein EcfA2